jgi:chromosome segregation ATPase
MRFIACAPDDIEALVNAVRPLQMQVERLEARERELLERAQKARDELADSKRLIQQHEAFMAMLKNKLREVL